MNILKKLIFTAAFIGILLIGASAEEIVTYPTGGMLLPQAVPIESEAEQPMRYGINLFSNQTLEDYLIEQCMNHAETIDISRYNLSRSKINKIQLILVKHPEVFVPTFRYVPYPDSNIVVSILPTYIFDTVAQDEEARALMHEKVNEYVELASQFEKPLEKLLIIHDKMVENCEYDPAYPNEGLASHHAYGLFKNDTAVCQGYAQAYYMVARELGIDIDFCLSDSLAHIWNYVKLDGKWYHVDVTWDDPDYTNIKSAAYHRNFLISDETRLQNEQNSYSYAVLDWATYLDELPKCGNDFESTYLFNLPMLFTLTYSDGYFNAAYRYTKNLTITFRSKNLKSGILATSAPISNGRNYMMYYYLLADYDGELTPIIANSTNGQYSSLSKQNPIALRKDAICGLPIITDTSSDSADIFIWDMNTLTPACEKISIH